MIKYASQYRQDEFVDKHIFKGKKGLKFLDVGAYDGVKINNTYAFEQYYDWTGICIEANPIIYPELENNRKCITVGKALSDKRETRKFVKITGYGRMFSTFLDGMKPEHHQRIENGIKQHPIFEGKPTTKEIIDVECVPLMDVLDEHKFYDIDFMSIDIEGFEELILTSVDWEKVNIGVILYENNYHGERIYNFMKKFGYERFARLTIDDVLVKKGYL